MLSHTHHTILQSLRQWRLGVVVWLMLGMSAAFASPLLNPSRLEVVCGTHGKAKLVVHDDSTFGSKARPANVHSMDCTLCAAHPMAPGSIAEPIDFPALDFHALVTQPPVPAIAPTAAPPPARAPPSRVSLFFQQSSERSI
ncbi:hypothetical protein [Diaphorobacter caeni]|uniref:hypothetical protein n=1 Tax=Diaphorobacter caeni TaxID=2784387 RepID=UPI00188FBD45|nr:hypothetical protein [Diaphorobacter caeni]MBF5007049.1 hypothetical protein [Diaphorobacter caeni]